MCIMMIEIVRFDIDNFKFNNSIIVLNIIF